MHRRQFWLNLIGVGLAGRWLNASERHARTQYYLLQTLYPKDAAERGRMHSFLRDGLLPAMGSLRPKPLLCLEALVARHTPQLAFIAGFSSLDSLLHVRALACSEDPSAGSLEPFGTGDGQLFEMCASTLLEATGNSPQVTAPATPPSASRVFELRDYQFPAWDSALRTRECLVALDIGIFRRAGIQPILCAAKLLGTGIPNLMCLISFDNLAARERAWSAFAADPEWEELRRTCLTRHGRGPSVIRMALYRATDYSPLR